MPPDPRKPDPAHLLAAPTFLHRDPHDGWQLADPIPMGRETLASLVGCARALCPLHIAPFDQQPALLDAVIDQVRRHMAYMHPIPALGLKAAFWIVDWSPLWSFSGTRRLQDLDPDDAAEAFARVEHSRWSTVSRLAAGARAAVGMAFYDLPSVHAAMHYDPVSHMRDRTHLRAHLLAGGGPITSDFLLPLDHQLQPEPIVPSGDVELP